MHFHLQLQLNELVNCFMFVYGMHGALSIIVCTHGHKQYVVIIPYCFNQLCDQFVRIVPKDTFIESNFDCFKQEC